LDSFYWASDAWGDYYVVNYTLTLRNVGSSTYGGTITLEATLRGSGEPYPDLTDVLFSLPEPGKTQTYFAPLPFMGFYGIDGGGYELNVKVHCDGILVGELTTIVVVPEFPSLLVLLFFMTIVVFAVLYYKKGKYHVLEKVWSSPDSGASVWSG
jgi:hypothetical protein